MTPDVDVSSAPNMYAIEFEFDRKLGVSLILSSTCALAARMKAFRRFPEYKRLATAVHLHSVEYVEIDWQTGRTIVVKQRDREVISGLRSGGASDDDLHNDWRIEESGGI